VFRVRNKSSLTFFEKKRLCFFSWVYAKWRVFLKQELILSSIVLVTLKEWLVLGNKLNYTHTKVGAKVQSHQPSVLTGYPTPANVKMVL